MNAVIGIIPSIDDVKGEYFISEENIRAISNAGGLPIMLPYQLCETYITNMFHIIDGLYLTGGNDIDPTLFEEEPHPNLGEINRKRDEFEIMCIKKALERNKPILAVCRGAQILNIALNGNMFQDIYAQHDTVLLQHNQKAAKSHPSHYVYIKQGTLLYRIVGQKKIKVNSRHHQANRDLGSSLIVSGKSSDGIIEAIESREEKFVLGVQWHPENMITSGDEASIHIYEQFLKACKKEWDDANH